MMHSVIIGGTKGLGKVIARQFSVRGDTVSVIGRTELPTGTLDVRNIHLYKADINDPQAIVIASDALVKESGKANYCVFLQRYRGKDDDWMGEFQTTLTATKNIVEHLIY